MQFDDAALFDALGALDAAGLDTLSFGVIGLNAASVVELYNAYESRAAGLSKDRIIGRPFFTEVAPCMNNYMVAERLESEAPLDAVIPYVLTLRMRPTPVHLRLLRDEDGRRRWILLRRD